MPLQRWHTMLAELLVEAPGVLFFCDWGCTEDLLLTSVAGVEAVDVAGGVATEALCLSMSDRC